MHIKKNIGTHMILHRAEFLPWCLPAAGPRHLGEASSPQGQQGRCGRCGCGWWVGTSSIEPRQKSAWNSCFTLQEHLSSRKWSTSMGDFLCQLRSPRRSTYVFIMFVHVHATFYPFWTMSRALPVWLKCQRRICPDFVESRSNATVAADYRSVLVWIVLSVQGI